MKSRALDSNGDWQFGRGLQSYKTEKQALVQDISTRIKQWKGNCFFAINEGVDYTNYLDIGTKALLDLDIKRVILQTKGVVKLKAFESALNLSERLVTITATVETVFGEITLTEMV